MHTGTSLISMDPELLDLDGNSVKDALVTIWTVEHDGGMIAKDL